MTVEKKKEKLDFKLLVTDECALDTHGQSIILLPTYSNSKHSIEYFTLILIN